MAIAYDSSTNARVFTGATVSFTPATGSTLFAVTENSCTAISFNSVAMTNIITYDPAIDSNSVIVKVWRLENPSIGTYDFTFTTSGGGNSTFCVASYTGVSSSQPEANNNDKSFVNVPPPASTQVASFSSSVTTVTDNAWAVMFIVGGNNSPRTFTAGASTTLRTSHGDLLSASSGILDSNGVVSPAGSRTLNTNWSSGSGYVSTVTVSLAPVTYGGNFIPFLK